LAETRLGSFLADIDDAVIIGTKVGRVLRANREPEVFDFSRDGVRESLAASLSRLGRQRVDIAYIHDPDAHFKPAARDALAALLELQRAGQVGAIGVGMNQWEMLTAFAELHRFDCFLLAGRYTLLDQSALKELLPLCLRRGISIVAGGVFNSGVLADPDHNAHYNYVQASREVIERVRAIRAVAERHDVPVPALAIQFPLAHPAITSVLVGARTPAEVEQNVAAFHHAVPLKVWAELKAAGLLPKEALTPTQGP
jgi:D-threo-aldose 1-dehydrogenase